MTLLVVISKSYLKLHNPPTHVALPRLYSYNILCHLSRYQRPRLCHVLPLLHALQVPLPLATPAITSYRLWRALLPQSTATRLCRAARPTNLLGYAVLSLAEHRSSPKRDPRRHIDGRAYRDHHEFLRSIPPDVHACLLNSSS